jgi:hypothetical protein
MDILASLTIVFEFIELVSLRWRLSDAVTQVTPDFGNFGSLNISWNLSQSGVTSVTSVTQFKAPPAANTTDAVGSKTPVA